MYAHMALGHGILRLVQLRLSHSGCLPVLTAFLPLKDEMKALLTLLHAPKGL